ncbi:MAG TPA: DUF1501 domain-containing protein [Gemmataceae bacterium]
MSAARAKSVLVVFTSGGQSQFETWDPKPSAPAEVRGAFGSRPTAIPGVRICEYLPRLARLANRYTIVRSMTHDDLDHGSACYLALTGQFHPLKSSNPPPRATDDPTLGAVLQRVRPSDRFPHSAFHINGPLLVPKEPGPGQYGGFLGHGYDPLQLGDVTQGTSLLNGITLRPELSTRRLATRRALLDQLDRRGPFANALLSVHQDHMRRAYDLIDSPRVRAAFDLSKESTQVRERYGRYRGGQACLLARRLVEAGVPWITVFFNHNIRGQDDHPEVADEYGWDTHNDIFTSMREHLLPSFDHSFSALLEDLEARGLLQDTLVVCMGEFGRAPLVAVERNFKGGSPGRKHWAQCYSVVLSGAGIRRGVVHGASDRHGAYPQSSPVTPGDLAATLFHALGIPADTHFTDLTNRPHRVASGDPVGVLFG